MMRQIIKSESLDALYLLLISAGTICSLLGCFEINFAASLALPLFVIDSMHKVGL